MNERITRLFQQLKNVDYKDAFTIESEIFMQLYRSEKMKEKPTVKTFIILSEWFGTSERSGVWVFYESTNVKDVILVVDFLKNSGEIELSNIIEKGIHNYQDEQYTENFDYPQEWIDDSEKIDDWIRVHEDWLNKWIYDFLIQNEEKFIELEKMIIETKRLFL